MNDLGSKTSRKGWIFAAGLLLVLFAAAAATTDRRAAWLAANTVRLMATVVVVQLPAATAMAWCLFRTDMPGRRLAAVGLALGLWIPLYLQAGAWMAGFGLQGWYTSAVEGPAWLVGWAGVVWVHAMAALPWSVWIVGLGLRNVEPDLEEQARLDVGAGVAWRFVTLRRAAPAVWAAGLWTALTCGQEMTVTDMFQVRTYAEEVYTQFSVAPEDGDVAVGASVVLSLGLIALGASTAAALSPVVRRSSPRPFQLVRLGRWRTLVGLAVWSVVAVWGLVPLGNLAFKAGMTVTATADGYSRGWSLVKGLGLIVDSVVRWPSGDLGWRPGRFGEELFWSLVVGASAASLAWIVGAWAAWKARQGGWRLGVLWVLAGLGLGVPGPIVGLLVVEGMNAEWATAGYDAVGFDLYSHSILAPTLVQAVRGASAAALILWFAFRSLPTAGFDAARCDGVSAWSRFWWLGLAARKPAACAAWLAALALALAELGGTIVAVPAGLPLASVGIFQALHWGQEDHVASLCLAVAALYLILAALAFQGRRAEW